MQNEYRHTEDYARQSTPTGECTIDLVRHIVGVEEYPCSHSISVPDCWRARPKYELLLVSEGDISLNEPNKKVTHSL